ncbi:MAG: CAP domain-containing protein, partial [Bacteroidota bacterium]|nr:CAP domain-containing protein [Bacteroidota bacterium]
MKTISFIILIFSITTQLFSQNLTEEELKLYNLIIEYRQEKKLPPIPLSPSLTIVAQTHVKDLADNNPDKGRCNTHSWSDKGKWTSCCY